MTDLHTLDEAFAEFERQADRASAASRYEAAGPSRPQRRARLALVAASVVAVAAVAGGAVLVSQRGADDPSGQAAGQPAASSATPSVSTPASASVSTHGTPTVVTPSRTAATPSAGAIPAGPKELARRLRQLLGTTATITVTETADEPGDPYIKGVLTASGAKGGYDFQILNVGRGSAASCEDPDRSVCRVRRLPDGSSLAVGTESGGGELYLVNLVRPDGTAFLWHLSTRTDPKGAGPVLGTRPPLTTARMAAILQSAR